MPKGAGEQPGGKSRSQRSEIEQLYQEMAAPARWVIVRHTNAWRPSTDVYETDESVVVRVELAGVQQSDLNITLADHVLIISGVRNDPSPKVAYHQMEIHYGEFRTEVYLHWAIQEDKIEAVYAEGFLQVILPKELPRRVRVGVAGSNNAP